MIFAVFDAWLLTSWINWSFHQFMFAVLILIALRLGRDGYYALEH